MNRFPLGAALRSPFALVVGAVLVWAVTAFLVWPNVAVLAETFVQDGELSTTAVVKLLSSERAVRSLWNSVLLAVALAVTTNVVGVFIVLVTHYFDVRGRRLLWLGYATTFIYGGVVLAAGYRSVYGADGIVTQAVRSFLPAVPADWFSGFPAVLVTMTFATTTNHLLFVSAALSRVDQQTVEAARLMGASPWRVLRTVVLPVLRPVLFAVTILSFLTGLGALSAPQVLGGRDFQTVAPMILTLSGSSSSRDVAALLAVALGVVTLVLLAVLTRIERGGTYYSLSRVAVGLRRQELRPVPSAVVHVCAYTLFVVYVLPVVVIVTASFVDPAALAAGGFGPGDLTLANYGRVLGQGSGLRPFVVSVVYSGLASLICVVGLLCAVRVLTRYRGRVTSTVEFLLHIPWVLPATLLALGLIAAYDHPTWLLGGAVLTGTPYALLAAFVVAKIPFTLRLLRAAFAGVDAAVEEAAENLGASAVTTLRRVVLPAVLPVAVAVGALNFNSLLDDYDSAVFLAHPLYQPLGLEIRANTAASVSTAATANNFVYTVLLMVITGLVMALVHGRPLEVLRDRRRRRVRGVDLRTAVAA